MAPRPVFHPGLGKFFAELRERKGWTQRQATSIAERKRIPGISRQTIWRLESGKVKNPEPEALRALADLYEVSYEELLARFWETRYGVTAQRVAAAEEPRPTTVEGFVAIPLLARPIAAGQPLEIIPDPDHDSELAFSERFVRRFTRPVCLRVGTREFSMVPTIQPGDVVVIDQAESRRLKPDPRNIYALNLDGGGTLKRVEVCGEGWLVISSDNLDKDRYRTRLEPLQDRDARQIVIGEVVWHGQYIGTGRTR